MKKIILTLLFGILISCSKGNLVQPIEKYRNKGIIVLETPDAASGTEYLLVKDKDSVFEIMIPFFDAKDLKPGDTL